MASSDPVKRTDRAVFGTDRQVDIEGSGIQGFVAHKGLYGHKIHPVLVEMGTEGMAEGVAGKTFGPSKLLFGLMDMPGEEEGINGVRRDPLFWEEPSSWPAACEPVLRKDGEGSF